MRSSSVVRLHRAHDKSAGRPGQQEQEKRRASPYESHSSVARQTRRPPALPRGAPGAHLVARLELLDHPAHRRLQLLHLPDLRRRALTPLLQLLLDARNLGVERRQLGGAVGLELCGSRVGGGIGWRERNGSGARPWGRHGVSARGGGARSSCSFFCFVRSMVSAVASSSPSSLSAFCRTAYLLCSALVSSDASVSEASAPGRAASSSAIIVCERRAR